MSFKFKLIIAFSGVAIFVLSIILTPIALRRSESGDLMVSVLDESGELEVAACSQFPDYPTGCECTALYMLLNYYGVDVSLEEIVNAIPKGSAPYVKGGVKYGPNPERIFVGDPKKESSYGVFNEPIKDLANQYRKGALSRMGITINDVITIVKSGNPVIVWYTTNNELGIRYMDEWIDEETGETVRWPAYEHAVVVCGYDKENIYYNDPSTGQRESVSHDYFQLFLNAFGGRAVYYIN